MTHLIETTILCELLDGWLSEVRITRSRRTPSRVKQKRRRYYRRHRSQIKRRNKRYRRRPRNKRMAKRRAKIRKRLHLRPGSRRRVRLATAVEVTANMGESMSKQTISELKELDLALSGASRKDLISAFEKAKTLAEQLDSKYGKQLESLDIKAKSKPLHEAVKEENEFTDEEFEADPLAFLPKGEFSTKMAFTDRENITQLDEEFVDLVAGKPEKKKLDEAVKTVKSDLAALAEDAAKMIDYVEREAVDEVEAQEILVRMVEYLDKAMERVVVEEGSPESDAKVLWFDHSKMEGSVELPDGKKYNLKLNIHDPNHQAMVRGIKEGDTVKVLLDPGLMDYGMVALIDESMSEERGPNDKADLVPGDIFSITSSRSRDQGTKYFGMVVAGDRMGRDNKHFYYVGTDEKGKILPHQTVSSSNMLIGDGVEKVGQKNLKSMSAMGHTWHLTGNKKIDHENLPNLDERYALWTEHATDALKAKYADQEDRNYHSENAAMVDDFANHLASGGKPETFGEDVTLPAAGSQAGMAGSDGAMNPGNDLGEVTPKKGKILWWDERDGNGIVKDPEGNEWYIDSSVIKSGKPKSGKMVTFTPHDWGNFPSGTKDVHVEDLEETAPLKADDRFEKKLASNKGAKDTVVDAASKAAGRGDNFARLIGIAHAIGEKEKAEHLEALQSIQDAMGHKPNGMDQLLDEIGGALLFNMVMDHDWTREQIGRVAWGLPLDDLKMWGLEDLRTTHHECIRVIDGSLQLDETFTSADGTVYEAGKPTYDIVKVGRVGNVRYRVTHVTGAGMDEYITSIFADGNWMPIHYGRGKEEFPSAEAAEVAIKGYIKNQDMEGIEVETEQVIAEADPSLAPPKKWFAKMYKQIHSKSPDYSDEKLRSTIGDIWYHKLSTNKRREVRGREGKKYGPAEQTTKELYNLGTGFSEALEEKKLSSKEKKELPASAFVYPKERKYPIHDLAHAKNALARSSGKPEEKKVKAAVYKKFPKLKKENIDMTADEILSELRELKTEAKDKKVTEYEVEDLGVEHSQYFQGRGTSHSEWDDNAVGIGRSLHEALNDAAEQLAMSGWIIPKDLEKEIEEASDEDLVSKVENENKPELSWTVTHNSRSMGSHIEKETFESEEDAVSHVEDMIKSLEKKGMTVEELEKGKKWEVTEPEDAAMVPDESGTIDISDNQDQIDEFEKGLDMSELQYYANIYVKGPGGKKENIEEPEERHESKVMEGKELDKFVSYCMQFYGPGEMHPIKGITPEMIKDAVGELALTDHNFGGGDTVDREKVRDLILAKMGKGEAFCSDQEAYCDGETHNLAERFEFNPKLDEDDQEKLTEFLEKYPDLKDQVVGSPGSMQLTPEVAKDLKRTYDLFISQEEADKRIEGAKNQATEHLKKLAKKYQPKNADKISIEPEFRAMDRYVGEDAGGISFTVSVGDQEEKFEPEALHYRGAYESASDAMLPTGWDWATWLMDDESPLHSDDFVEAYAYDQISSAMDQFAATLNESDIDREFKNLLGKFDYSEPEESVDPTFEPLKDEPKKDEGGLGNPDNVTFGTS